MPVRGRTPFSLPFLSARIEEMFGNAPQSKYVPQPQHGMRGRALRELINCGRPEVGKQVGALASKQM